MMGWFDRVANGLGTLLGVLSEVAGQVIQAVKSGYESYRSRGGATRDVSKAERAQRAERMRQVNEELMDIRRRAKDGGVSEVMRKRWDELRQQRDEAKEGQDQAREVQAAETIIDKASDIESIVIDDENVHILTANAFTDVIGKKCEVCGRKMKLQWRRDLANPTANDVFWGCVGWYFVQGQQRRCTNTQKLASEDFGIMVDRSLPEFQTSAREFEQILSVPDVQSTVEERVDDLAADLRRRGEGVEIASCPVHGEALVLKKKGRPTGLLDMYFLACPYWLPREEGCPFVEKLKSPSQLAVLLKSQTGQGVL